MLILDLAPLIIGAAPLRYRRRHRGATRPCCVRMLISALTTDLVMENPSSGVSTLMPGGRSARQSPCRHAPRTHRLVKSNGAGGWAAFLVATVDGASMPDRQAPPGPARQSAGSDGGAPRFQRFDIALQT